MRVASIGLAALLAVTAGAVATLARAQSLDPAPVLTGKLVWTHKPTGDAISAKRPARVIKERVSGGAVLDCRVAESGGLTDCTVASEAPLDYGFGASALQLADQYRVASTTEAGEATAGARVRVPVTFNAARVGGAMTVMGHPIWMQAPTVAAVEAAYPLGGRGVSGVALLRCAFDIEGRPTDCAVRSQNPPARGFGNAALALADSFVVLHDEDDAAILPGVVADIPIAFNEREADAGRLPDPQWLTEVSSAGVDSFFPAAARAAAVTSGTGTVNCLVSKEGGMTDCRVAHERPVDLGFGEAALQAAQLMRLNTWSPNGRTFAGRRLTVPIRLRLPKADPMGDGPPPTAWGWQVQDVGSGRR